MHCDIWVMYCCRAFDLQKDIVQPQARPLFLFNSLSLSLSLLESFVSSVCMCVLPESNDIVVFWQLHMSTQHPIDQRLY